VTPAGQQAPTPAEEGQARAYLTGVAHGFGILLDDWTGLPDGTATVTDDEGTTLIFTGGPIPFDAVMPCRRHGRHRVAVTHPADLDQARTDTAVCSAATDTPTVTLRLAARPSPLYLITRAARGGGRDQTAS
jgi:hypothetical protein